jgi:hypothetical protein
MGHVLVGAIGGVMGVDRGLCPRSHPVGADR